MVASTAEPKLTVAPGAKWAPAMLNVNAPTGIAIGFRVLSCGRGFSSVTALDPDLLLSFVSAAVTVMPLGLGGNSGAVNNPVEEIVPVAALPPATPFTDQVKEGLEPSLAVAENCCVAVPGTDVLAGVTVSEKGPGTERGPLLVTEAQPASASAMHHKKKNFNRFTAGSPLQSDSDLSPVKSSKWTYFSRLISTVGRV